MLQNSKQSLPMSNLNLTVALVLHLANLEHQFSISEAENLLNEVDDSIDKGFAVSLVNKTLLLKLISRVAKNKHFRGKGI